MNTCNENTGNEYTQVVHSESEANEFFFRRLTPFGLSECVDGMYANC